MGYSNSEEVVWQELSPASPFPIHVLQGVVPSLGFRGLPIQSVSEVPVKGRVCQFSLAFRECEDQTRLPSLPPTGEVNHRAPAFAIWGRAMKRR